MWKQVNFRIELNPKHLLFDFKFKFLGQELQILKDHVAEVITAKFSKDGNLVLTGSFDETAIIWDLRAKEYAVDFHVHMNFML